MGHFARDCRAEEKVEETINLALDDATNEGILLMDQNEELKIKEHDGAKDDGGSREVFWATSKSYLPYCVFLAFFSTRYFG